MYDEIYSQQLKGQFVFPAYGKQSITEIEPSIRKLFGVPTNRVSLPDHFFPEGKYEQIILFVIDGLGWHDWMHHSLQFPFYEKLFTKGKIFPITSVFPSTTPAALTTIHTGFTPQEHGLLEWYTYFEEFQKVIMPMQFRATWDEDVNSLLKEGGTVQNIYDQVSMYETLAAADIESGLFVFKQHLPSVYNEAISRGAQTYIYSDGPDLFRQLALSLTNSRGRNFYNVYWGEIDSAAHKHGPGSDHHLKAMKKFSDIIEQHFFTKLNNRKIDDVLIMFTADHGQVKVHPENATYLEDLFNFEEYFQTTKFGNYIVPTGSPNDVFLHVKEDKVEHLLGLLRDKLANIAEVWDTSLAYKANLFGLNQPSPQFKKRAGNIMILPFPGHHVWFKQNKTESINLKGLHGGLSDKEMIIPFAIAPLSNLIS
jgi:predicted AlkP superfamily pyrophosphatase or phosphodiesterase